MVKKSLVVAALTLTALALIPAAGHSAALKFRSCPGDRYLLINQDQPPAVKLLRIKMRATKADGYAPRCLVAEAVAGDVQSYGRVGEKLPSTVRVVGAKFDAGPFRCTYTPVRDYRQAQCVAREATVRFRLVG